MARSRKVAPIPAGFRSVTPYLSVDGGAKALEFYGKAFGAKEVPHSRTSTPDGAIINVRFKIGDTLIMLSDRFGPNPPPRLEAR